MKQLIVIPCHDRPGFLRVCLEHIQAAPGWQHHEYLFSIDRDSDACDAVISEFARVAKVAKVKQTRHEHPGNVFNIMNAYRIAQEHANAGGFQFVHLIEDDIFVAPDYFHFHEKAWQTALSAFCVSACRNQNWNAEKAAIPGGADNVYYHQSYQSLGVSIRAYYLPIITEHARPEYWSDPIGYCRETFPDVTAIPPGNAEQAGLIHRIVHRHSLKTCYPVVPRAYHAGFVGRNRPGRKKASEYTAEEIRAMSAEDMNWEAERRADIQPCEMVYREIKKMVLI